MNVAASKTTWEQQFNWERRETLFTNQQYQLPLPQSSSFLDLLTLYWFDSLIANDCWLISNSIDWTVESISNSIDFIGKYYWYSIDWTDTICWSRFKFCSHILDRSKSQRRGGDDDGEREEEAENEEVETVASVRESGRVPVRRTARIYGKL